MEMSIAQEMDQDSSTVGKLYSNPSTPDFHRLFLQFNIAGSYVTATHFGHGWQRPLSPKIFVAELAFFPGWNFSCRESKNGIAIERHHILEKCANDTEKKEKRE